MKTFPIIEERQVVLVRVNTLTGHVLDELFVTVNDDNQAVYTVTDSLEEAVEIANQIVREHTEVECALFDSDQKVLSVLKPNLK